MDNAIAQDACIISPDSETRHEGDCDGASRPFLSSSTHEETGNTPPKLGSNYRWAKGSKLYLLWSKISHRFYHKAEGTRDYAHFVTDTTGSGQRRTWFSVFAESITLAVSAIIFYSWTNILLVFVPVAITTYLTKANPIIVFTTNATAIIPLSGLLTYATECIASEAGDTVGALINISFGNLVEVVMFAALANNQLRVVQASLVGSILVNLLLILGTAILSGSFWYQEQRHDIDDAQILACLLCLSVFSLLIPTAFYHSFDNPTTADTAVLKLSRASALTLLVIYVLYLIFQLRSPTLVTNSESVGESRLRSSVRSYLRGIEEHRSATPSLSRIIKFADEETGQPDTGVLANLDDSLELESVDIPETSGLHATYSDQDGSEDHDGDLNKKDQNTHTYQNRAPKARTSIYALRGHARPSVTRLSPHRSLSHDGIYPSGPLRHSFVGSRSNLPLLLGRSRSSFDNASNHSYSAIHVPLVGRTAALILLILSSLLIAVCAEFLVNTIDSMVAQSGLSEVFIGLIILPIAGNCAEHITAVTVASKNKLDLAIGVSVGSSIQIALFVSPLVVILGWMLDRDMTFYFSLFETVTLVASTFLVNFLLLNGKTNFLEGSLLCACYSIIGVGTYLFPKPEDQNSVPY